MTTREIISWMTNTDQKKERERAYKFQMKGERLTGFTVFSAKKLATASKILYVSAHACGLMNCDI